MRRLFFLCPDDNTPYGGIKIIYRQAEILSDLGFKAYVYHETPGFKIDWFKSKAKLAYPKKNWLFQSLPAFDRQDLIVLPEYNLLQTYPFYGSYPYLVFNQNAYMTFNHSHTPKTSFSNYPPLKEYLNSQGIITVSEDNQNILKALYPSKPVEKIILSIENFSFSNKKEKIIAYSPAKEPKQALAVISLLYEKLTDWTFVPLIHMDEETVKRTLQKAAIYLNFTHPEGFGLPAAEALKSGALVIGYDGRASVEYMKSPYATIIPFGDWIAFREAALEAVKLFEQDRKNYDLITKMGSEALSFYNDTNEKESIKLAYEKYL